MRTREQKRNTVLKSERTGCSTFLIGAGPAAALLPEERQHHFQGGYRRYLLKQGLDDGEHAFMSYTFEGLHILCFKI